jgi:hypothetical protein
VKEAEARAIAIRQMQLMDRYDHWSYADFIADFDNNEELAAEYVVKQIMENPYSMFDGLLDTMEQMLEELEV